MEGGEEEEGLKVTRHTNKNYHKGQCKIKANKPLDSINSQTNYYTHKLQKTYQIAIILGC